MTYRDRSKLRFIAVAIFLLWGMFAQTRVHALCHDLGDRVVSLYSRADVVAVGRVIHEDHSDIIRYEIKVKEWIKGGSGKLMHLEEDNGSGRIGLHEGETYLIFANKTINSGSMGLIFQPIGYGCASAENFSLPVGNEKLREARAVRRKAGSHWSGSIRVRVMDLSTGKPVPNCPFLVESPNLTSTFRTDKLGWIHAELPAGIYRLTYTGNASVLSQNFDEDRIVFELKNAGGWDQLFYRRAEIRRAADARVVAEAFRYLKGQPLAGVKFILQGHGVSITAKTDENGMAGFSVPVGHYFLTTQASKLPILAIPGFQKTYQFDIYDGGFFQPFVERKSQEGRAQ